jgi:hypothetical protein
MITFKTMTFGVLAAAGLLAATPSAAVITNFATFTGVGNGAIVWKNNCCSDTNSTWRGNGTGGALFTTAAAASLRPDVVVPGAIATSFSFTVPALAPYGAIGASFSLFASTVAQPALPFFSYNLQPYINGSFSFLSTAPLTIGSTIYAPGANLLSGSFTGLLILGPNQGTTATALASPNNGGNVTYSSDFLNFAPNADGEMSLPLSALVSKLNNVNQGLNFTSGHALRSFRASIAGSFASGPAPMVNNVPEPQVWALLVIGFGLVGIQIRRRSGVVAC